MIDDEIKVIEGDHPDKVVTIFYTNWRGEKDYRKIVPQSIWFGTTQWHSEPGWLLTALDVDKNAVRHFSMRDIHGWG
jgi:predicted DNA-binding transcriptional regulator YafY